MAAMQISKKYIISPYGKLVSIKLDKLEFIPV